MVVVLETERLILRQFTEADIDSLVALDSDPQVMRGINGGHPTPVAELQEHLAGYIRTYAQRPGYGFWAAVDKATGAFIGWFHFRACGASGDGLDEAELGYRLRRAVWGRGYATEGSRALIDKGFTELDVRRVVASTDADNVASRRVMEKSGMQLVRTFSGPRPDDPDGEELDGVEYALERTAWTASNP